MAALVQAWEKLIVMPFKLMIMLGLEISEGNCSIINFPKKQQENSLISALASKKWLNEKDRALYIFWEGHKILQSLHLTFDWHYIGQK